MIGKMLREIPGEYKEGVRDALPIVIGLMPFGVAYGIIAVTMGLYPLETILMSVFVFAGASQMIAAGMLGDASAGFWVIILMTVMVNFRHILMSVTLSPHMSRLSGKGQGVLSFLLTDEAFAITTSRIETHRYSGWYQLGAALTLYLAWICTSAAGVYLGGVISDPLSWRLDFAMPAVFIFLLIPMLKDRNAVITCLVAGAASLLGALYLPGNLYMIVACAFAVLCSRLMGKEKRHA